MEHFLHINHIMISISNFRQDTAIFVAVMMYY